MRKILSSLMLLTLVVLFISTYLCSTKTEQVFKAQIEQLNQSYAGLLQIELLDYQRGLLVSEVKTRITRQNDSLPLQHQIRHFPWKISAQTSIAEDSDLAAELAERLPLQQLQLLTDVYLDGSSQSRFALPELSLSDNKVQLQLHGLRFDFDLDRQLSDGKISFRLDRFTLSEPGEAEFVITDVMLNSQFADLQGIPLGDGEFRIRKISLEQQQNPGFELNELRYDASNKLENGRLATGLNLQIAALKLGGETFTDGQLRLQVNGIDATAVRDMQAGARQLQAGLRGQQVDPIIRQLQMLELYSRLFQAGLTISLEQLSLSADGGALRGKGRANLQGLNLTGSGPAAFDKLDGNFQLDIDRNAFNAGFRSLDNLQRYGRVNNPAVQNELAEQLAGGLIQQGIFSRRDDGGYRLELSLEQGQAELNGNLFRW